MKILVAGRAADLQQTSSDGFALRHAHLLRQLDAQVHVLALRARQDDAVVAPMFPTTTVTEIPIEGPSTSRRERLRRPGLRHAPAVRRLLAAEDFSAAITFGPWLHEEYDPIFERLPTIHLFEEDIRRMPDLGSQRRRARALRRIEVALAGRRTAPPAHVVIIGPAEAGAARRLFPRSPVTCIPQTLDESWAIARRETPLGHRLLCVGALDEDRNAGGLADCLARLLALNPDIHVTLVSARGFHPVLNAALSQPSVESYVDVTDLLPHYQAARMVLVPATRATGVKATVLQAWATGRPVATTPACALTLAPLKGGTALVDEPSGLADQVAAAWPDDERLQQLAKAGAAVLDTRFGAAVTAAVWRNLVEQTAAKRAR